MKATIKIFVFLTLAGSICLLSCNPEDDSYRITKVNEYGEYASWDEAYSVVLNGNYVYVGTGKTGLQTISNTRYHWEVVQTDQDSEDADIRQLCVHDGCLYATNPPSGLRIYNLEDPSFPVVAAEVDSFVKPENVFALNNYVYVVDSSGLWMVNVSEMDRIFIEGFQSLNLQSKDIFVQDSVAYVVGNFNSMLRFNVSNPRQITSIDSLPLDGGGLCMAEKGNLLYIANWAGKIHVFDISDKGDIQAIGGDGSFSDGRDIAAWDQFLFMATYSGLIVYDVYRPDSPTEVGHYNPVNFTSRAVAVNGAYAFLAGYQAGEEIAFPGSKVYVLDCREITSGAVDNSTDCKWELKILGELP